MAAVSMRHTKISAEEAALLAGELKKPSWQSQNEGIHERVSFEDAIWGFDLAGGAFYKTPLRVTAVKPDSRAQKAGIRPGDKLLRINGIDTSTLTIQEAHEIIIESGIHLQLAVTAPEDEEDAYYCYEDELQNVYNEEEERRLEEEKAAKRIVHAKVSSFWSLQWPWVSKRRIIYRESNCFMVPSKYEGKHQDKFPIQPVLRTEDDIVLHSKKSERELEEGKSAANDGNAKTEEGHKDADKLLNGNFSPEKQPVMNGVIEELSEEEAVEEFDEPNGVKNDDELIDEVLEGDELITKEDEDQILDGILSSTDGHSPENSSSNER